MEKWLETRKGGDFAAIGKTHNISPVIARILRNRELMTDEEITEYLHGGKECLHSPHLMKDADAAAELIAQKIEAKKKIRIIGDYDIDGVSATYILLKAFRKCGAEVDAAIPDRLKDGYGINEHLITQALEAGVDTIVTCDNGIAALDAIAYAKENGMTVIVTDHHEIPYEEIDGQRTYKRSLADAIVNPKQQECTYPYKELCGAAVAYKLVEVLYERMAVDGDVYTEFIENAAFATIGDVMNLTGENRIIVKLGLEMLRHTNNFGMLALIAQNKLDMEHLSTYHIGFVLGPCLNASGRLDTAKDALELLMSETPAEAAARARHLVELNDSRKSMTAKQLENAITQIEVQQLDKDKVMVVYLPECHESLAGIIAGRIREKYYRPVFVLTRGESGVKGSGRSIEEYSMYDEMNRVADLFSKFGGHPMAAGLSLDIPEAEELEHSADEAERIRIDHVAQMRKRMNELCTLTDEDLMEKVHIDVPVPIDYIECALVEQLKILDPCGKGNPKPVFADRGVHIRSARVLGKNRNVLKLELAGANGGTVKGVYFGDCEKFLHYLTEKYSAEQVDAMLQGRGNEIELAIIYDMSIDDYNGANDVQVVIKRYR